MTEQTHEGPGAIAAEAGGLTIATTALLDARTIMAFAAGINDTNPAYFDDTRDGGLRVHPGIAFRFQWASRHQPDRKPNLRAAPYGVHASTDLRIHKPFRQGEAITTQGRVLGHRQIPPGVYSISRYRMTNSDGHLMAEMDMGGIIRGAALEGEDRMLEKEVPLPELRRAPSDPLWEAEVFIPWHLGQQYTECAEIYNPIHTEPSVAQAAGLPNIILHGSATKSIALTQIVDRCFDGDARRVTRLAGQLRGMVLMDTNIRVQCLAETKDGIEKTVFFRVLNEEDQPAIANGIVTGSTLRE